MPLWRGDSVSVKQLADDFCFVKLTSTGNGTVNAIQRDLMVQRDPANLPAVAS